MTYQYDNIRDYNLFFFRNQHKRMVTPTGYQQSNKDYFKWTISFGFSCYSNLELLRCYFCLRISEPAGVWISIFQSFCSAKASSLACGYELFGHPYIVKLQNQIALFDFELDQVIGTYRMHLLLTANQRVLNY